MALNGELGSGKTEFVHGLAQGLEVPPEVPVACPSFTLAHEYPGRVLLVHLDLYRLEDLPPSCCRTWKSTSPGAGWWRWNGPSAWPPCCPRTTWRCSWPSRARPSGRLTFIGHGPRGRELVEKLAQRQ